MIGFSRKDSGKSISEDISKQKAMLIALLYHFYLIYLDVGIP
jgi:hypothetical protein